MIPFDKQISSLNCILSEQQPQFLHHWSGKTTQRQPDTHARNFGSITLMPSVRFCCWFSHCSLHFSLLNAQIVALSKSLSTKMESQWVQGGWNGIYNHFGWSIMHHFLGGIFTRLDGRNPNFRVPEIWKAWILDWSSFRASTAVPPPSLPISKYIVIAQHTFRSIYANHLQSNKGVVQHPRRFFVSVHNTMSTYLCRYLLVCHQIFCSSINRQLPALFTSYFCDSSRLVL